MYHSGLLTAFLHRAVRVRSGSMCVRACLPACVRACGAERSEDDRSRALHCRKGWSSPFLVPLAWGGGRLALDVVVDVVQMRLPPSTPAIARVSLVTKKTLDVECSSTDTTDVILEV